MIAETLKALTLRKYKDLQEYAEKETASEFYIQKQNEEIAILQNYVNYLERKDLLIENLRQSILMDMEGLMWLQVPGKKTYVESNLVLKILETAIELTFQI